MKTPLKKFSVLLAGLAASLGADNACLGEVATFTNTPAAVSNTYSGYITLQIGGLTNHEPVVIQKFLDANANGVIDAGDPLMQQFNLTDGQPGMVIGGVTNLNVPGDGNAATGAITATLNFQDGDFIQNTIGKYAFRLSSPTDHFAPITNFFTVTNFPYAQKITGNVVNNGTNVPNAIVTLFPPPRASEHGPGNPVASVVANNSGAYTIMVPAGSYVPLAFNGNFVADFSASPLVAVGVGATVTTNLILINATTSISGQLVDSTNSSIGLPGMLTPLDTHDGLLASSFSDANGNFTVRVTADQWNAGYSGGLTAYGYVGFNNDYISSVDTTTGSVSGLTVSFPKATALFYGSVKDNLGNPLPGIDVGANDNDNNNNGNSTYSVDGYSDANGNYVVGVLGGLGSDDPWQVQVSSDSCPTDYIFSQTSSSYNGGVAVNAGQAVQQNITAILATNHISGNVQFNGTNVVGVQVYAYATIGTNNYQAQMDTDDNGNYSLNVANGTDGTTWSVNIYDCSCSDSDSLSTVLNGQNYEDPASQNVTINNNNQTANLTVQSCNGVQIITTSPLPDGTNGVYYNFQFDASSCNNNFTWSLNSGTLPPGLTLYSGGAFNGTPTTNGTYNFSVHVNDNNGHSTNQSFSLYIAPASMSPQITTTSLPNGNVGASYSTQLQATGGQTPYTWSLASDSLPLPNALTLSTNGIISGIPTTNGLFNFVVQVTDANLTPATHSLGLIINSKPSLSLVAWLTNRFSMRLTAAANQNYTVEMSTNLATTNWMSLFITNNTTTNSFLITDPNATNKQRFYRILIGP